MKKAGSFLISLGLIVMVITMAVTFTSEGAAAATTQNKGTLVVGLEGDPTSFNPDSIPDDFTYAVAQNVFNRLAKLDADEKIVPDLAQKWVISEDGREYTFNLVKGIKWHDGKPFSSADVKWTFEEIISKKGFLASSLEVIDSISTPDENTVVFKLKKPDASFLSAVSYLGSFILPKHIYEGTDWATNPATQKPIGTGPFKFVSYQKGVSITLNANQGYFKGAPGVDRLVFKIVPDSNTARQSFLNGELDVLGVLGTLPSDFAGLTKTKGVKIVKKLTPIRYSAVFNLRKPPFNKVEVRKALLYAINRQEIVVKALKGVGQAANGFYTPAVKWAYNNKVVFPKRDVQKAKALLKQAGLKPDRNGNYLSFELVTFNVAPFPDMATVIKSNLKEAGIDVKITVLEQAAWIQKCLADHDFALTIMGGTWGPDPSIFYNRVGTNGSMQFMGYSNPQVDKLFEEGKVLFKTEQRGEKYKQMQQLLFHDLPLIPLSEVVNVYVYKDYISGFPADQGVGKVADTEFSLTKIRKK